jgi:hypothetical protein
MLPACFSDANSLKKNKMRITVTIKKAARWTAFFYSVEITLIYFQRFIDHEDHCRTVGLGFFICGSRRCGQFSSEFFGSV